MSNLPDIIMSCVMTVLGGGKVGKECPQPLVAEVSSAIVDSSKEHNVPAPLIAAVIRNESGFNPQSVGYDGLDLGLMQIRRGGAIPMKYARYSDRALQNIRLNISIGTSYLAQMIRRCPKHPLSMYNGAHCRSSAYAGRVMSFLWRLKEPKREPSYSLASFLGSGKENWSPL